MAFAFGVMANYLGFDDLWLMEYYKWFLEIDLFLLFQN